MKIKFLLILTFLPFLLFAQSGSQKHTIAGTVVDSATGQKLPSVNVVVFSKNNDKLISGTATNLAGKFSIKDVNKDSVYIKVSLIGYNTIRIDTVLSQKTTTFSSIKIGVSSVAMNEIVVSGNKPMVEFQADKNIINVDRIPGATGSLVDALANSGMVDVDPSSKKVSLRGQSLEIWIDGKPSAMGDVMLSSLPAESVEKVELITNPSAKDNPEGSSAILNIITKKGLLDNISGSVSLNASTQNSHYGSLRLGYKTGKFNVYGGVFGYIGEFKSDNTSNSTSYESLLNYLQTSNGTNEYFGNS
ncbi:MAG: carboxypeptidase-like regulatory domain-containing protein, partial [Bacteroidota bacterium]|nr:carboxypeptidase-like regulatory domain-containing protein [Bacteroidota bacterium]